MKKKRGIDATKTKEKILYHANALFVKKGFNGTSMRDIAGSAGLSQSMISHHFGSKQELWDKIQAMHFDDYVHQLQECDLKQCSNDYRDELLCFMNKRIDYFDKHPEIVRMMTWQSLDGVKPMPDHVGYKLLADFIHDLELAQRHGEIRQDIEAAYIGIFILIVTKAWFQHNIMWLLTNKHKDKTISPRQELDGYVDAITKILDEGIFVK